METVSALIMCIANELLEIFLCVTDSTTLSANSTSHTDPVTLDLESREGKKTTSVELLGHTKKEINVWVNEHAARFNK